MLRCRNCEGDVIAGFPRDVGREKLGGLEGGEGNSSSAEDLPADGELRRSCRIRGDDGRMGSSSGDSGREPGIGSRPDRVTFGVELSMVFLASWVMPDVSYRSKALPSAVDSPAGNGGNSSEDFAEFRVNLLRIEATFVDDEGIEYVREDAGVHGREDANVVSLEQNEGLPPVANSSMGDNVIPKF